MRELLAQRADLFALALILIQRSPQPGTDSRFACALANRQPRRRVRIDRPERLDLGAQLGVRVEERAAHPCMLGDRCEGDGRAVSVELPDRRAGALLRVPSVGFSRATVST